jgi:probable F420-dependent oxidoreductase
MTPRVTLKLPTHRVDAIDEFLSLAAVSEMARAAEAFGYHAVAVTDHPFPGVEWLAGGGHHTMDPFVTLAVAAAATTTIRLQTSLLVLPYRPAFITAKAAASLDVISGGRTVFGVGAGYAEGEFVALGADFESRNEVTDQTIVAMKSAWQSEPLMVRKSGADPLGHQMLPFPVQQPLPQILIGGNSRRAMMRVVEHGNGWLPMFNPAELSGRRRSGRIGSHAELGERIVSLRKMAQDHGRTDYLEVHYSTPRFGLYELTEEPQRLKDELSSYSEVGVDALIVDIPGDTRADWIQGAKRLMESIA